MITHPGRLHRRLPRKQALSLGATLEGESGYKDAAFVVITAPTNYDTQEKFFDTSHGEEVIDLVLKVNPDAVMVIKSTILVGYTQSLYMKYAKQGVKKFSLPFSPEFLRESKALYDNLNPSRIIVGTPKMMHGKEYEEENETIRQLTDIEWLTEKSYKFAELLVVGAIGPSKDLFTQSSNQTRTSFVYSLARRRLRPSNSSPTPTLLCVSRISTSLTPMLR